MSDSIPENEGNQPEAIQTEAGKTEGSSPAVAKVPAPKPTLKVGGLSPAAQKLQNMREKAAQGKSGAKPAPGASAASFKAKTLAGTKKTSFQRKAV